MDDGRAAMLGEIATEAGIERTGGRVERAHQGRAAFGLFGHQFQHRFEFQGALLGFAQPGGTQGFKPGEILRGNEVIHEERFLSPQPGARCGIQHAGNRDSFALLIRQHRHPGL